MTTSERSGREMSGGKTPLPNEGAFKPRPLFESEGNLSDKKYIPGLRIFGSLTDRGYGLGLSCRPDVGRQPRYGEILQPFSY